jgi:hypothetical protein
LARAHRFGANDLDGLSLRRIERRLAKKQLRERTDAAERIVHFVRDAGNEFTNGREAIRLHESHAQLALLRHVAADEEHAGRIRFGQPARRECDDARGTTGQRDLHLCARGTSLEGSGECARHRRAIDGKDELHQRAADDLVRLQSKDFAHGVIRLANPARRVQHREHGIRRSAKQRAKAPLRLLHRLEQLRVRERDGQQVGHCLHALELERREGVDLRRHDRHRANPFTAPLHGNDGHAVDRALSILIPVTVHLVTMLEHVGDAPASAGANDTAHGRAGDRHSGAGERRDRSARRRELDSSVISQKAERRAIRLRDVRSGFEETIEHAARVELQRDLLAEPPHAMQHALRVVQLERALDHALLERRLELQLRHDAKPKFLGGESLRGEREVAVQREHSVEGRDRNGELEGAGVLQPERRGREGRDEQPRLSDAERQRNDRESTKDDADEPTRVQRHRDGRDGERQAGKNEGRAERGRRRLPRGEEQRSEEHYTGKLRARDQSRRERRRGERCQLHSEITPLRRQAGFLVR